MSLLCVVTLFGGVLVMCVAPAAATGPSDTLNDGSTGAVAWFGDTSADSFWFWADDESSDDGDESSDDGGESGFFSSLFGFDQPAEDPASFEINGFYPIADATAGETVTVSLYVMNTGEQRGTQTVEFSVAGTTQQRTVTLDPGRSEDVTFEWRTPADADGEYTVTVATEDERDSRPVDVENPPHDGALSVSLDSPTLDRDETTRATATVTDDGTTVDVTDEATFTTNDLSTVWLDGRTVTARTPGTTTVAAEYYGQRARTNVTVEAASNPVTSIDLDLSSAELRRGETVEATVTATYADGSTADVTDAATLHTYGTHYVTLDGATVTGQRVGVVEITAGYNESHAAETVTVAPDSPVETVDLSLGSTTLSPDAQTDATVTATYANGSTADVTDAAAIHDVNSSDVASVLGSTVTAHDTGTATLRASYLRVIDETTVSVEPSG